MAKTYIIIDGRGRATLHTEEGARAEVSMRLGAGESYQLFEAQELQVQIQFGEASGTPKLKSGKKRGRPPGRKKTRRAGRKAKARKAKGTGKVGRPRLNVGDCTEAGCGKPSKTRGLCSAHYQKHRRLVQEGKPGLIAGGAAKKKVGRPAKKKTSKKAGRKKATKKAVAKKPAAKKTAKKATVRKK